MFNRAVIEIHFKYPCSVSTVKSMLDLNVICWIPVLLVARLVVQMVKVSHVVEHREDLSVRTAIKSKLNMHLITIKHESSFQSFTKDLNILNEANACVTK